MIRLSSFFCILIILFSACKTQAPSVLTTETDTITTTPVFRYPNNDVSQYLKKLYAQQAIATKTVQLNNLQQSQSLYELNNYMPLWTSDTIIEKATQLLRSSKEHGLSPTNYHITHIDSLNKIRCADSSKLIQRHALLDIYISDALILLCNHLYYGILEPNNYHSSWNYLSRAKVKTDSIILSKIAHKQVDSILHFFEPRQKAYSALKNELKELTNNPPPDTCTRIEYPGILNRLGDSNQYVYQLKTCLLAKGLYTSDSLNHKFDSALVRSLIKLQNKHGLTADGLPGKKTYEVLNWDNKRYLESLKINLERLRWLPREWDSNYIWVNIPAYQLDLFMQKQYAYSTRIIVGKYDNQTPVIYSNIDYLVFNPCWTVPHSIASEKMLPRLKKDSTYLDKRNMFITQNGVKKNHHEIDFSQYSKHNFPFKIFQNSDTRNALGKVKFMFPNKHTIYLHDTPGKQLFSRDHRAFSHGCVRVQNADNLAKIIVKDIDSNPTALSYFYGKGYPVKVYLKTPIALHITYLTCNYNPQLKQVQFYRDIYGFDYNIIEDLKQ